VRNSYRFAAFLFVTTASVLVAPLKPAQPVLQAPTQPSPPQVQQPTPTHPGPVIVLDPAHGGLDDGARGPSGVVEKDLVLVFARTARLALEREGFRVVMTRNDDSNPSYDDRAALANSYRDVILVSFHISSTGMLHTARTYSYRFPDAVLPAADPTTSAALTPSRQGSAAGLVPWEDAQRPYTDASHQLADLLQMNLARRFPGSPSTSSAAAVRGLRSVSAPAVAVEISSVAVSDPNELVAMAALVSTAVVQAIVTLRPAPGSTAVPESK
jgi:N-acetylmuramoyl-L-alanine amidase